MAGFDYTSACEKVHVKMLFETQIIISSYEVCRRWIYMCALSIPHLHPSNRHHRPHLQSQIHAAAQDVLF